MPVAGGAKWTADILISEPTLKSNPQIHFNSNPEQALTDSAHDHGGERTVFTLR